MKNKAIKIACLSALLLLLPLVAALTAAAEESIPPKTVNVMELGAAGDGVTDDTAAINMAAALLCDGDTLYFPKGVYLIHAAEGAAPVIRVEGKRDVTIQLHDEAELRLAAVPDGYTDSMNRTFMLYLNACENITLTGGTLVGDALLYTGSIPMEHSFAVNITDCNGVTVRDVEIKQMRGDGIYVTSVIRVEGVRQNSRSITVEDCHIHDCYRNGIALITTDGCVIRNTVIHGIQGRMPQAAVDIEAQYEGTANRNVLIENCSFYGNGTQSVAVSGLSENIAIVSTDMEQRVVLGKASTDLRITDCTVDFVGVYGKSCVIEGTTLGYVGLYGGEIACADCTFDGKGLIPYRVLVTKSDGQAKGDFTNCTFVGRGLCALGGSLVLCHTRPASLTFTDCQFRSCGLIPFLGRLGTVERESCAFRPGIALWGCLTLCTAAAALLLYRRRKRRVWVSKT